MSNRFICFYFSSFYKVKKQITDYLVAIEGKKKKKKKKKAHWKFYSQIGKGKNKEELTRKQNRNTKHSEKNLPARNVCKGVPIVAQW